MKRLLFTLLLLGVACRGTEPNPPENPPVRIQATDTKDGVAVLNTTNQDGFSSNIASVDGITLSTSGGGGGQNFSDNFNRADADPPGAPWAEITGNGTAWNIDTNQLQQATEGFSGFAIAYNSACDGLTQYACVQLIDGDGGLMLRYTGTASDGFYVIYDYGGDTLIYWSFYNNTGWVADIASASLNPGSGDYMGVTVQGTGSSTIVKVWDLGASPGAFVPTDVDNWESASDPADVTFTDDPGSNNADTGTQVGIGEFNAASAILYDNWTGGDTE